MAHVPETLKTTLAIVHPELAEPEPITEDTTNFGEIKLVLIRKIPPCWLVFIVQEVLSKTAGREKSAAVLSSRESSEINTINITLARYVHGFNSVKNVMGEDQPISDRI